MIEKEVRLLTLIYLDSGGHKRCVSVENETSITIEGYKSFNFDFVADEEVH